MGQLFLEEKATVVEKRMAGEESRNPIRLLACLGASEYVDSGNSACTAENGIVGGKFAEWVNLEQLNKTRPDDPSAGATETASRARSLPWRSLWQRKLSAI